MISKDILNIGVSSTTIDLFEGQYPVPNGMLYNSYLIIDEKTALFDTVEENGTKEWLENLKTGLNGRKIDYFIISHMEPDHSANISALLENYPDITVVASQKTFVLLKQFYNITLSGNAKIVTDGDLLPLGKHTLKFYTAPMIHWPEVIMTYELEEKILFSADAFGKFGAENSTENWVDEARRYYFNIVGKYGIQVQNLFKKISGLTINSICSLHGPVLNDKISYYINLYDIWSSYRPEQDGVLIAYTSIYGNTKKIALLAAEKLKAKNQNVTTIDIARTDISYALSIAFKNSKLIVASTTYDGGLFPKMDEFLSHLVIKNFQNRKIALIENGSWGPQAAKKMTEHFTKMKNIHICENKITIRSAANENTDAELNLMIEELINN